MEQLCTKLAMRRIGICIITGLPSGVVTDLLDGRLGYCLVTPATCETATVSVLVASPWRPYITLHEGTHAHEKRIALCSGIGGTLIVGIYAPHVGPMDTNEHTLWVLKALTMVEK